VERSARFGPATIALPTPNWSLKLKNKRVFKDNYDFWDNFNQFILRQYTPDYAKDVIRQARQFHQYLASGVFHHLNCCQQKNEGE
jgi:hypothetical protein